MLNTQTIYHSLSWALTTPHPYPLAQWRSCWCTAPNPKPAGKTYIKSLCLTNPLQPFSLFFFQALVLLFYLYVAHSPVRVFITHAFMISDITSGGAYHIHLCVITVAHGEKSSPEAGLKCLRLWCTTSSLCIRRPLMTLIDTTCLQTYTHTEQRCARVSKKGAHLSYPEIFYISLLSHKQSSSR